MAQIIIGLILFILGVWGIVARWYSFVDLICVLLPMVLIVTGIIGIVSGISNISPRDRASTDAR